MNFKVYDNANAFEKKAESILWDSEDVFSLFLGVWQGIKAGKYEPPFMATIEQEGKVLALFQWPPPIDLRGDSCQNSEPFYHGNFSYFVKAVSGKIPIARKQISTMISKLLM